MLESRDRTASTHRARRSRRRTIATDPAIARLVRTRSAADRLAGRSCALAAARLRARSGTHLRTAAKQAHEPKRAEHVRPAVHVARLAHSRARKQRKQCAEATASAPHPTTSAPLRRPCSATLSTATNSRPSVGSSVRRARGSERLADGFARAHTVGEQTSDARERAAHLLRARVAPRVRMKAPSRAEEVVCLPKRTCAIQQHPHIESQRGLAQ